MICVLHIKNVWSDEERNAECRYYRNACSTQDGIKVITGEFQEKRNENEINRFMHVALTAVDF